MKKWFLITFCSLISSFVFFLTGHNFTSAKAIDDVFLTSENIDGTLNVVEVSDSYKSASSLRLYSYIDEKAVTTINNSAFDDCSSLNNIMIPKSITNVPDTLLSNPNMTIYFTGSLEEFKALAASEYSASVFEYSFDEGFINLWDDIVITDSVCDVIKEKYETLYSYYINLSVNDRLVVDQYKFDSSKIYTIAQGMAELNSLYGEEKPSAPTSKDLNQNTTIIFVVAIAIIGMTSICVFYSFKNNELIS